jgi:hypothetical protein
VLNRTDRRLWAGVAASLIVLAVAASPALAASGTIVGRLTGLPAKPQFALFRAVDARGVIVGFARASSTGAYSLSVKPGVYAVIGSAANSTTRGFDATALVRVRAGRRTRPKTRLHAHRASTSARSSDLSAHSAAAPPPPPPVALSTLHRGNVLTSDLTETEFPNTHGLQPPDRRAVVLFHFFAPCTRRGVILVDTSPEVLQYIKQEANLQRAGRLDPGTPFHPHLIKPQFSVTGETVVQNPEVFPMPTLDQVMDVRDLRKTQGANIAGGDIQFSTAGEPIDDNFITATLISASDTVAGLACP